MGPHLSVDFEADSAVVEANRAAYGVSWPRLSFQDARLIVSFGADFLDSVGHVRSQQLDFAERAQDRDRSSVRLHRARRSLTGLNADQWIACRPGTELAIANALAGRGSLAEAANASGVAESTLTRLQQELAAAARARALRRSRSRRARARAGRRRPQSDRRRRRHRSTPPRRAAFDGAARTADVLAAVEQMRAGAVPIAFVRGANPAFALPSGARFAEAFAKVPFKVSFSMYPDETTELCDLILPDLHSLESWGDAQVESNTIASAACDGSGVLRHPCRRRSHPGRAEGPGQRLAVPRGGLPQLADLALPGGTTAFTAAVTKGIGTGSVASRTRRRWPPSFPRRRRSHRCHAGDFYLVTYLSPVLGDGRGENKPWLQELPDPVAKVLWSSWVEIHPQTAARLGIERGDIVESRRGPERCARRRTSTSVSARTRSPWRSARATRRRRNSTSSSRRRTATRSSGATAATPAVSARARRTCSRRARTSRARSRSCRSRRSRRPATTRRWSPPKAPRQHGRGIAQALTVTQLAGLQQGGQAAEVAKDTHIAGLPSHEFARTSLPGRRRRAGRARRTVG